MAEPATDFFAVMGLLDWRIPQLPAAEVAAPPHGALTGFHEVLGIAADHPGALLSFDLFDTLVVRDIFPPEALHDSTARLLRAALAGLGVEVGLEDIGRLRQRVTERLRTAAQYRGGDGEAQAEQVMAALLAGLEAHIGQVLEAGLRQRLLAYEFHQELCHVHAAPGALEALAELGRRHPIVVLSDTQWSARQLGKILAACGLDGCVHGVYASSETGLNKRSGRLFRHMLQVEGRRPEAVLHFGDHLDSDCQIPRSLGMVAYQLVQPEVRRAYRQLEQQLLLARQFGYAPADIDPAMPTDTPGAKPEPHALGRQVFGLPFFLFARHILDVDNRQRFAHLFFLSRDAHLPWQVFQAIADGVDLFAANRARERASYVHLSRASTEIPDVAEDPAALSVWCQRWASGRSAWQVLEGLGLDSGRYRCLAGQQLREGGEDISLPELLSRLPRLQDELRRDLAGKKALLERYLESIGFFRGRQAKVLMVDLGWKGTVLRNLEKLFGGRPDYPQVHGLFWGVSRDYGDVGFTLHPGYFSDSARAVPLEGLVRRCHEAFEMVAAETSRSCIGYRLVAGTVMPRWAADEAMAGEARQEIQRGVLDAIPAWLAWHNAFHIADELRVTALARMLQPLFQKNHAYHGMLMDLQLDLDLGSGRAIRLGDLVNLPAWDLSVAAPPAVVNLAPGAPLSGRSPAYAYERLLAVVTEVRMAGKPVVLWGMGVIGRLLLPHLQPLLRHVVDANPALQGTALDGCRVLAPEALLELELNDHLVLFTPLNRSPQLDLTEKGAQVVLLDDRLR